MSNNTVVRKKMTAKYIEYSNNPSANEHDLFPEKYFSGANATITFNKMRVTECSAFNYTVSEQHKPIYGYASRQFDDVAIGNRIVIGSFMVPFTDALYMRKLLKKVNDGESGFDQFGDNRLNGYVDDTWNKPPTDDTGIGKPTTPPSDGGSTNGNGGNVSSGGNTNPQNLPCWKQWDGIVYKVRKPVMITDTVGKIQDKLISKGYKLPKYGIDKKYHEETESAVKKFQKDNGLYPDGEVGEDTWNKLFNIYCTVSNPSGDKNTYPNGGGSSSGGSSSNTATPTKQWDGVYYKVKSPYMKGQTVKDIQNALISKGYKISGGADGVFGNGTRDAVIKFQKDNGLSADGVVGKDTWNKLFGQSVSANNNNKPYPGYLIKEGSTGQNVVLIQKQLGVSADGIFGRNTKTAVINFQKKVKVTADGIVGKVTWDKLFN